MDWDVVVILAAVTWLDGVRRVPAGALVLRRVLGGQWSAAEPAASPGLEVVAWWTPFTLALVVPTGGIPEVGQTDGRTGQAVGDRIARCQLAAAWLRVLGALVLVGIVGGVPAAVAHSGAWGFVLAAAGTLLVSLVTAVIAAYALRTLGDSWRRAFRVAAALLYPFSAPRAAEVVLERAAAGAPPLAVARHLLGASGFAAWIRPRAYDALTVGGSTDEGAAELLTLVERSTLAAIVQALPAGCEPGDCYCLRCARAYRPGTALCADCRGVPLVPAPDAFPLQIQV